MVQDPHIPGTLKGDIGHICLYGRKQEFRCLREYRAPALRDPGMACEVIFCNHAAHLVSEFPCILRQMQMHYGLISHIIPRGRLFPGILVEFLNGGKPPHLIQKEKGKSWPCLPFPGLGMGPFWGPWLLELSLNTGFHLFSPSLAVSCSTCLHRSRCVGVGGTSDRSLLHWWLLGGSLLHRRLPGWSLLWRSGSCPNTRPTGAYSWAFSPPVQLLPGLTWLHLRPLGQGCPNQVGALSDLASLDKQPMEVAPSFYPEGELRETIKAEASRPLKLLGDECHVVQRGLLLNSDRLSLPGSEVVEETFPCPSPLCLPIGSLDGVPVVDLEHVLKVSSPSTGSILSSHLGWSGMGTAVRLELRVCLAPSRGGIGCCPSSPSGATCRSAWEALSPGLLSSSVLVDKVSRRGGSV